MKKIYSLILIISILAGFTSGCKKDKGDPPVLPPVESMSIDFTNFAATAKSLDVTAAEKGTNQSNWQYAAVVAGTWRLIINTTLAVPVAAFNFVVNKTPAYLSTKTWQWSYDFTYLGGSYKARLTGQIRTSDVQWKMYISKTGTDSFTEFLWFEGTSKLDGTGGQWILYESVLAPNSILQIDWTKTGNAVGYVKYTYVKNDAFKNSFIEYGLTTNALNAYYTIHYYAITKFVDVNVEWNTTTKNGHVKSSEYLDGVSWYCWDANKLNVTCQ